MARMTLLDMVQDILNDMSGDEVNSIADTIESEQIAQIIKTTFNSMMSTRDWPHTKQMIQLVASGTTSRPTHMTFQNELKELLWVKYDKKSSGETRNQFLDVRYLNDDDFIRHLNGRNNDDDFVDVITDPSGIKLHIRNDVAPQFYTSFDDETIVFDAYDSAVDSTLQASKTQARAYIMPTLVIADATIPDLPDEAFMALLQESKSRCSLSLRQVQDVKAEQDSIKQNSWLSRNMWNVDGGIKYKSYGRKRSRTLRTNKETSQ